MRTSITQARRHRWLLASALAMSVQLLVASTGVAEEDHLQGYKIKDLNEVPATNPVIVSNQFGTDTCELKKPHFLLVRSEKNVGDDPRGGPAGDFVCYKAKCTGASPPVIGADSQFGLHSLELKKAKLVCLPVAPPPVCPAAGGNGQACSAYVSDSPPGCADCCDAVGGCAFDCQGAQMAACNDGSFNDACGAAINAAGCADECCP